MTKSKTLPSIRISENVFQNLKTIQKKMSEDSFVELSLQDVRRLAYSFFIQQFFSGTIIKIQRE